MKALEKKLPVRRFMRVHRSYIISIEQINALTRSSVQILEKCLGLKRIHIIFYANLKIDKSNCQSFTLSVEQNLPQEDNEYWLSLQRVRTFAETLFTAEKNFKDTNLSYYIRECRQCKSKSGTALSEFVQSKIAEVQAARLIALLDLPFKFVQPQGKRGDDYDLLVTLPDNTQIACEVKRKIDGQSLNVSGFSSTKKRAYKQLGSLPRKVVFIKVPGSWEEQDFQSILYPKYARNQVFHRSCFLGRDAK